MKKGICLILALFLMLSSCMTAETEIPESTDAQIVVMPEKGLKVISPDLFGAVINWTRNAEGGADPRTGLAYDSFVEMIKELGITNLRYGGGTISATVFAWKRAIGPIDERPMNRAREGKPGQPSIFGPDEIGDLIERTGSRGTMILNFAREEALDAVQYLAYMTMPVPGNPSDDPAEPGYWAALRAANGHPEPYDFNWFDVGNEEEMARFKRWKNGDVVKINEHTTPSSGNSAVDLYAFGGITAFEDESVIGFSDMDKSSCISKGTPNQDFYANYPPVVKGSQTLLVDGAAWTEVDDLSKAGADEQAYMFDNTDGKIVFGDNVHGEIPAKGKRISLTYQSGPHDGFVQFYDALKKVNPDILVAAQLGNEEFMGVMGTDYPYDGLAYHPLGMGFPDVNLPVEEFMKQHFAAAVVQGEEMDKLQNTIWEYAGNPVILALSAYGHAQNNLPENSENAEVYHLTLMEGLVEAAQLIEFQNIGITLAHRFLLNDTPFNPDTSSAPTARRFNACIISNGSDDHFVATPNGLALSMVSATRGMEQVSVEVRNNPEIDLAEGAVKSKIETLKVLAASDDSGKISLVVINQDLADDIAAEIYINGYKHKKDAVVYTLNGPDPLSVNTLEDGEVVKIDSAVIDAGRRDFTYTFPAHSVTRIELTK